MCVWVSGCVSWCTCVCVHASALTYSVLTGTSSSGKLEVGLNVNLRDGIDETPISLALWTDQFLVAQELMDAGADIESTDSDSPSMLYVAIVREKAKAARYLLDNGADFKKR